MGNLAKTPLFRATVALLIAASVPVVASALVSSSASAQTVPQKVVPPTPPSFGQSAVHLSVAQLQGWRVDLEKSRPKEKGCFTVQYPRVRWQKVACVTPPNQPYYPTHAAGPMSVGNVNDYVATTQKLITSASGAFEKVSGVLNEADGGTADRYSLQLNTNMFHNTPACNGAANPTTCKGWEQFVYSNSGSAFIQYWLISYTNTCPSGWNTFGTDCWVNAPGGASYGPQPITDLLGTELTGKASSSTDTVQISGPDGEAAASNNDNVLSLANFWNNAEFNVFGDCCGSAANFNSGVTIKVYTAVDSGSSAAPGCVINGTTGETNNTALAASCSKQGGNPAIVFSESNPPGSIWNYTGPACTGDSCPGWKQLDNNNESMRIAATDATHLYQLWNTGDIFEWTGKACKRGSCPGWKNIDNSPNNVEIITGGGFVYRLENNGKLFKYAHGWKLLDTNPAIVTVVASTGGAYELHKSGNLYKYKSGTTWQLLDDNPNTVAITAGGTSFYEMHNDGTVWNYTGPACTGNSCPGWQMINNNGNALRIVANSGNLYELDNNGVIWQYTGTPCSGGTCPGWQMLDNNPAGIDIAADDTGNLYELHNTGRLWHYTGQPCSGGSCPGWQLLDDNTSTGRIAATSGKLYQLHVIQTPPARALVCYDCR